VRSILVNTVQSSVTSKVVAFKTRLAKTIAFWFASSSFP